MKRKIFFLLIFVGCSLQTYPTWAQNEITLNYTNPKNKQTVNKKLYDINNGNFLFELPLTFHLTADNILFMIVGSDRGTGNTKTIWMFDRSISLEELSKKNKNLEIGKSFRKEHKQVEPVLSYSNNVELFTGFQNNYESMREMPKIIFFKIKNKEMPVELKLKFYLSETSGKDEYTQVLTAEAGTIKAVIHIEK